jgi:hypothetical protein
MSDRESSESPESKAATFLGDLSRKSDREVSITEYFRRQTRKTYRGMFKDIEISKGQFFTLYLLLISFASILALDIFLSIENLNLTFRIGSGPPTPDQLASGSIPSYSFIIFGVLSGFIIGGSFVDKIRGRKYQKLYILLIISIVISLTHVLRVYIFKISGDIIPGFFHFGNSFIAGILFMFFITFYIDFTTILERGRVYSMLLILLVISILVIIIATAIISLFPVIIIVISLIYLYKRREQEEPYKPVKKEGTKTERNFRILQYLILLMAFNLSIGMFIPMKTLEGISISGVSDIALIFGIIIAIFLALFICITVGLVFDFFGRKATISNIILAISIVNFIELFNIDIKYFDLAIVLMAFLAAFMAVPLLISDVTERERLGKVFGIAFTITLFCAALGVGLAYLINQIFVNEYTARIFIIGIVNFALIVTLVFLTNIKEAVSPKEKNWADNLLHIYVIHESGILLYDHSFIREELLEADLVSGGFVGLIAILQEITKEKQRLKIIDHGGKKIMFGFNSNKTIVFALVITEELLTLRNKLAYFIDDFEKSYQINLNEFTGVNVDLWKERLDPLLEKHFKRKYFELIPEFATVDE